MINRQTTLNVQQLYDFGFSSTFILSKSNRKKNEELNNKGMERKLGNSGSIESPVSCNINFCPPFDCMLEDILPHT